MKIILWLVVVPSVASVLLYFLMEFIKSAKKGIKTYQDRDLRNDEGSAPPEPPPGE